MTHFYRRNKGMNSSNITFDTFHERLSHAAGKTSFRQLSKLTDTHPETVRRYMHGQAPSASFIQAFCEALGISGDWLLSGIGPMNRRDVESFALKNAEASTLWVAIAESLFSIKGRIDDIENAIQVSSTKESAIVNAPESSAKANITAIKCDMEICNIENNSHR
jgi:transcriptional regulator with XRE-family HTH domain